MELSKQIEGLLFYKATPVKLTQLQKLFDVNEAQLTAALDTLAQELKDRAVRLTRTEREVQLTTTPTLDELIESVRKDELKRDIGKAGAETLAIILYKEPISRVEIDRIRGVNSAFILRHLMVRGLIERNTEGKRHTFGITPALLAHLGVTHKTELPNHAAVLDQLEKFEHDATDENT